MEYFKTVLRIDPDYAEAYGNIGIIYVTSGQIGEAIRAFQTAVAIKPNLADAHYNLYLAYRSKGLSGKAMEHLHMAQSLDHAMRKN